MQHMPNTELQDLLANKKAKTRRLSELSKTEQNRWVKLNEMLDERRRGENVLSGSQKINILLISKKQVQYACNNELN